MKNFFYDLHIHSCLSPCGDEDMTPNNIANMAALLGLDFIAVADHNSAENCRAVMNAAGDSVVVLPAIEVCTAEEVHCLVYFSDIDKAESFGRFVYDALPDIQNNESIFGRQIIRNSLDEETGRLSKLLINACSITADKIDSVAKDFGGICVPAHINKTSNSVFSNLGYMPPELEFSVMEIWKEENLSSVLSEHPELSDKIAIFNSDAHYLGHIKEGGSPLKLRERSREALFEFLKTGKN